MSTYYECESGLPQINLITAGNGLHGLTLYLCHGALSFSYFAFTLHTVHGVGGKILAGVLILSHSTSL